MLNESYCLARALEDAGMALEQQHPKITIPGRTTGPVIRVRLGASGREIECERVVEDDLDSLWAHRDGNQNYFPVIRLSEPLMSQVATPDEVRTRNAKKPSAAERRKLLLARLAVSEPHKLTAKAINDFARLREKAEDFVDIFENSNPQVAQVCRAFASLVPNRREAGEPNQSMPLLDALRDWATTSLPICDESDLDALEVLLFSAGSESGKKTQLALDTGRNSTIYGHEARKAVIAAFLSRDEVADGASSPGAVLESSSACCFTGRSDMWTDPFPKVKLPALGKEFCIFSMFKAAKCNFRYGKADTEIIPVSKPVVQSMQESLNAVLHPDREGETWRRIAGDTPGSYDQLIAYVDGKPDISAPVASLFGTSEEVERDQYEADASAVCEALDGVARKNRASRINLFILKKASEGQAFVALAESPTVAEVLDGAHWWRRATNNVPLGLPADGYCISLPIFNREQDKSEAAKPSTPYPGQVVALLTQAWLHKRGGAKAENSKPRTNKLRSVSFRELLDVMLQREEKMQQSADHILSLCLHHASPLLAGLAACQGRQTQDDWKAYSDKDRLAALRAVSTIGIALFALGSKKEVYMEESAFQIGQMLALADRLHSCYCKVVRGGALPPNLIGNAQLNAALENPEQALAVLADRLRVYQAWAQTADPHGADDKKSITVKWAKKILSQFRVLAVKLHEQGIPTECSDMMKAHMLLGYMAGEEAQGEDK